jgi:hypothetical protein
VSAGVVLAGTDFGGAQRYLAASFAALAAEITGRFAGMLVLAGPDMPDTQPLRRDLVKRTIALDPTIDQAIGESSQLRYHSPILQTAVHGLFEALDGWRSVATHLRRLPRKPSCAAGRVNCDPFRSCSRRHAGGLIPWACVIYVRGRYGA